LGFLSRRDLDPPCSLIVFDFGDFHNGTEGNFERLARWFGVTEKPIRKLPDDRRGCRRRRLSSLSLDSPRRESGFGEALS